MAHRAKIVCCAGASERDHPKTWLHGAYFGLLALDFNQRLQAASQQACLQIAIDLGIFHTLAEKRPSAVSATALAIAAMADESLIGKTGSQHKNPARTQSQ